MARRLIDRRNYIAHLDGVTVILGGWLNHNYRQLGIQIADSLAGGGYSFVVTLLILYALDFIGKYVPALRLRASEEEEVLGMDDVEIGEFAVSTEREGEIECSKLTRRNSTTTWSLDAT